MPVELKARRRLSAFVLFRRVQIVASERVRRVRLCECGVRSFGVRREPLCVLLVVAHLRVVVSDLRFVQYLYKLNV